MARRCREARIRVPVVRKRDKGDRQCPPPASCPRVGVDVQLATQRLSLFTGKQSPRDDQVAGRVADADEGEVEHARQPAVLDQEVPGQEIAMEPDRRPGPVWHLEGCVPLRRRRLGVDYYLE